jgi:hypothetical protein
MIGKIFKYEKTGKEYTVVGYAKMKDPMTRKWLDSVIYTDGDLVFVREKQEFSERFKECHE